MNGPPKALIAFCKLLNKDMDLQLKVKSAVDPQHSIDIAKSVNCMISLLELRTWPKELSADYFPWATKGNEERRQFFRAKNRNA